MFPKEQVEDLLDPLVEEINVLIKTHLDRSEKAGLDVDHTIDMFFVVMTNVSSNLLSLLSESGADETIERISSTMKNWSRSKRQTYALGEKGELLWN